MLTLRNAAKAKERLTDLLNAPSVAIARASAKRDYVKTLLERKRVLQSYNVGDAVYRSSRESLIPFLLPQDIYASFMKAQEKLCATALLSVQAKANYDKLTALNNQQDMKTLRATEDVKRSTSQHCLGTTNTVILTYLADRKGRGG